MDEIRHIVQFGSRPMYEVVEPEDGVSVVIRYAGNHNEQLTLLRCSLPALAKVLTEVLEVPQLCNSEAAFRNMLD